jgi:hypothetical protein
MQKINTALLKFVLPICLLLGLSGCQPAQATSTSPSNPGLVWQVQISGYEIKDNLNSVEAVTQYDGSKIDVKHNQSPQAGSVYVIINVSVSKTGTQSAAPFDWKWLVVKDAAGNTYNRLGNDTFLDLYKYTPRITGLQLRLGEYKGWMCYEIPAPAAKGAISLVYTGEGSQQELVVQK